MIGLCRNLRTESRLDGIELNNDVMCCAEAAEADVDASEVEKAEGAKLVVGDADGGVGVVAGLGWPLKLPPDEDRGKNIAR
jgi:hypothetical protein